ncbi:MAG TPA: histidine kinase, partial [Polyangia bacterium]|nr:histidine kinase [Polyangia bacterium]
SLAQARLATLELQLQPHFLFNTLHTIAGLVRQERSADAVAMIAGLSDLLRYSLDHAGRHAVPLGDELAIVGRYLEIQRLRFSDRLTVELDAPDDTRRALVPTLLLQPLAENAVRHGIEAAVRDGSISVRARRDGDALVLVVANSGDLSGDREGIGIANTRARLTQLFGARHSFRLESAGGNVTATIRLPFEEAA